MHAFDGGGSLPSVRAVQYDLYELEDSKSQNVISDEEKMGPRKPPLTFTEHGVAQLSSVLNSKTQ